MGSLRVPTVVCLALVGCKTSPGVSPRTDATPVAATTPAASAPAPGAADAGPEPRVLTRGAVLADGTGSLTVRTTADGIEATAEARVFPLTAWSGVDGCLASMSARLVDLDGDARNDVVVYLPPQDDQPIAQALAFILPDSRVDAGDGVHTHPLLTVAMAGASSLDDAVSRAQAVPRKRVAPAQACSLLARGRTAAGLRAIAAPGGTFVAYSTQDGTSVGDIQSFAAPDAGADVIGTWTKDLATGCPGFRPMKVEEIHCDPVFAGCTLEDGPSFDYDVFTFDGPRLELLRAGVYTGS
jgi:hypothetical protein